MFTHYGARGFILKACDKGEADQSFTVFSEEFGKLVILAKAARKMKSKLKGGLNLFSLSEIEFIQGKSRKTLTDAKPVKMFSNIRKDLGSLRVAFRISETLDSLTGREEPDRRIWILLEECLEALDKKPALKRNLVYYYFFWNLADFLGFKPALHYCALCQEKIVSENLYFDSGSGGTICGKCFKGEGTRASRDAIKIIRVILEKDLEKLSKLKLSEAHFIDLEKISEEFHSFLSEKREI